MRRPARWPDAWTGAIGMLASVHRGGSIARRPPAVQVVVRGRIFRRTARRMAGQPHSRLMRPVLHSGSRLRLRRTTRPFAGLEFGARLRVARLSPRRVVRSAPLLDGGLEAREVVVHLLPGISP